MTDSTCDCQTVTAPDGETIVYTPCLACALKSAGHMLMEAGSRLSEAIQSEKKVDDRTIGGSD